MWGKLTKERQNVVGKEKGVIPPRRRGFRYAIEKNKDINLIIKKVIKTKFKGVLRNIFLPVYAFLKIQARNSPISSAL